MLRCLLLICCLALVGGCQSGPRSFSDVHTGQQGYRSARMSAHFGPSSSVYAIAAYSQSSDVFAVFTEFSSLEGRYVYLDEAWSYGQKLAYASFDRLKVSCSGGCIAIEKGKLELSREAFEAAARTGLEFRLVGRRGSVLCKLSPQMFEQVLRPMRGTDLSTRTAPADTPRPPGPKTA